MILESPIERALAGLGVPSWSRGISRRYEERKSLGSMHQPRIVATHASLSEAAFCPAFGRNWMTKTRIVATMMAP